jgi:hypothetical protein
MKNNERVGDVFLRSFRRVDLNEHCRVLRVKVKAPSHTFYAILIPFITEIDC